MKPQIPEQALESMRDALEKAFDIIGGTAAMARKFEIKMPAVSRWRRKGYPPMDRCLKIQEFTGGKVTVHDLRPDVFGPKPTKRKR